MSQDPRCPECGSEDVVANYVPHDPGDGITRWVVGTFECQECPRRQALERRAVDYADGVEAVGYLPGAAGVVVDAWLAGHAAAREEDL